MINSIRNTFNTDTNWKKIATPLVLAAATAMAACTTDDAKVASRNLSKAADNFEIDRRIIFYNGITDSYMLTIEGRCAIEDQGNQLEVTCKTGKSDVKKHFLGLSDNVTYFAEQVESAEVNMHHYRVTFKPQSIIPDIDFRGSAQDLQDAVTPGANEGPQLQLVK